MSGKSKDVLGTNKATPPRLTHNLTQAAAPALVRWYFKNHRALPWRSTANPYRIWVSEIILQQTRVAQGIGYYERFLERFPTLQALAEAPLDDVLKAWEGLGYYSRARNLHATAQYIHKDLSETWPTTVAGLEALKGIGPYTARAIASICFGVKAAVVDGNVLRVLSRLLADKTPINAPSARTHYQPLADALLSGLQEHRAADFNQAIMELGATVCTPTSPSCTKCPWQDLCNAHQKGAETAYPVKKRKAARKVRYFEYYLVSGPGGTLRIRQRDASSYWKGLWELPSEEVPAWVEPPPKGIERFRLTHEFSHFQLRIRVSEVPEAHWQPSDDEVVVNAATIERYALSRAVQKVVQRHWQEPTQLALL